MSGHSKWSQIKRQKGVTDARRGQLFTKIGREISVAIRAGGVNEDENSALRLAIAKARQANMPKDTIKRAFTRASGAANGENWEAIRYEAYSPGGAALLVDSLTDNRNRTVATIRSALTRAGGNMGDTGSVAWLFARKGVIAIDLPPDAYADPIALAAIDAGAADVQIGEGLIEILTEPAALDTVRQALQEVGSPISSAEIAMRPTTTVELDDAKARSLLNLIDTLEDLDDVQRVYTNAEFSESVLVEA